MEPPLRALIVEDEEEDVPLLVRELGAPATTSSTSASIDRRILSDALGNGDWDVILSDYSHAPASTGARPSASCGSSGLRPALRRGDAASSARSRRPR